MYCITEQPLKAYPSGIYVGTNDIPKTEKAEPCIYGFTFADNTRLKIGVSRNLKQRMRDHTTLAPDFKMVFVIYFSHILQAEKAEQEAILALESQYSRLLISEVFSCSDGFKNKAIFDIVQQPHKHFNHVEWVRGEVNFLNIPNFPIL